MFRLVKSNIIDITGVLILMIVLSFAFQNFDSQLPFELPPSVNEPHLKVRDRILLKDFLDGSRFEKTKVKLF